MSISQCALVVLSKPPIKGKVKTRLTPHYSFDQAARLHQVCLEQVWFNLKQLQLQPHSSYQIDRFLSVSQHHSLWNTLIEKDQEQALILQPCVDLGGRMYHAFQTCFENRKSSSDQQYDCVILLGTDSPSLPLEYLRNALDTLSTSSIQMKSQCVFGPACDGGYYLIGVNRLFYESYPLDQTLFNQIQWSTPSVLTQTLTHLQKMETLSISSIHLLPFWYDVDTAYDLNFMRTHLPLLLDSTQDDVSLLSSRLEEIQPLHTYMSELPYLSQDSASSQSSKSSKIESLRAPYLLPQDPQEHQNYIQSLQILFGLTRFGERMDLETPKRLNILLGDPLSSYQSILIGGTNGKGTTAAYLNTLGQASGYRVGRFNSPHLISFRERISINGTFISHADVSRGVHHIMTCVDDHQLTVSFFEATWALAIWYFQQQNVDYVIWEVGLGGRLDATNVCSPCASAITTIGLDHTHLLGDTHQQIAYEKGAIFRHDQPALTSAIGEGKDALIHYAQTTNLKHLQYIDSPPLPWNSFPSRFHARNAALAWGIHQALHWSASPQVLTTTEWPGRLEEIDGVWLDCAHNPQAIQAITPWIEEQIRLSDRAFHLVFGASQDKEIHQMIDLLNPYLDHVTWVSPHYPRCARGVELAKQYPQDSVQWTSSVIDSVSEALIHRDSSAFTLVSGSCFLVGEARAHLLSLPFPEGNLQTTAR